MIRSTLIRGETFEFIGLEILLLNNNANFLNIPAGPTGWKIDGADASGF